MPPNTSRVAQAVLGRIAASVYELTVFYPKKRVALILGAPTQLPASPLLRVPNPQKPVDADVEYEPIEEPMTMKCLFLSVTTMSEARKERLQADMRTWSHNATALVRVRRSDAERADGQPVFFGSSHAEVNGDRFKILAWSKMGNSLTEGVTYHVLLGAGE